MRQDTERLVRLLGAWRDGAARPARALAEALTELIDGAHLPAGWRMPGQRELAAALGVARGTVAAAYAALASTGRVSGRVGSGTVVRRAGGNRIAGEGRLSSFDADAAGIDLSSGALPGTDLIAEIMTEVGRLLRGHHLADVGYHPMGIPELRAALARDLTGRGTPTAADQILVTAGSQQAVWLIAQALAGPGTVTVVEDPTYRGSLEALSTSGGRVLGVPFREDGVDQDLLAGAAATADLLYLQTSLHNPTGVHTPLPRRRSIAEISADTGVLVVDDQSQAELPWTRSERIPGLEGLVDPERLLVVGTFSKLFWGGIRVGWIRGPRELIGRLAEVRRGIDLGGAVPDQLAALLLLPHADRQRQERRAFLAEQFDRTVSVLGEHLPSWRWWMPAGGSGMWTDTGTDAVVLAQRALARGIHLTAGPAFSPHGGHRRFVRLPVWHPSAQLSQAAVVLRGLSG